MILKLTSSFRLLLIVFSVFINSLCYSQTREASFFSDSTSTDVPTAIPVIEIINQIQFADEKIAEFIEKSEPKSSIKIIDSLFPIQKKEIDIKKKEARDFINANPNKQKINNLLNNWNRYNTFLTSWQTTLNNHVQRNGRLLDDVIFYEETWKLTNDNAIKQNVPVEIKNNVNHTWNEFKKIKKSYIAENNKLLSLESKIIRQISVGSEIINQLEELKSSDTYGILNRRHDPIWKTSFRNSKTANEALSTKHFKNTLNFFKAFEHYLYIYIIIVLLIVFNYRYLKKGFELYPVKKSNTALIQAKEIISTQSWIVMTFTSLLIAKFYFSHAPLIFDHIITVAILALTVPILYNGLNEKFKNVLYAVIVFYIISASKTYVWFESYEYRIYLFVEALLVAGTLYYFTKPYRKTRKLPLKEIGVFFIRLTPVIYFLSATSFLANILGYTNLADLSLKICTQGGTITVIIYTVLKISESISLALIHRHFGPKRSITKGNKELIQKKILKFVQFSVFVLWLIFFLNVIDQFNPIYNFFEDLLTEPNIIGSISFTIGDVLSFLFILAASFFGSSFISFLIDDDQGALKFLKLPKGVPAAISLVIRYLIIAFGVVLALSSLGIDLGKFNLMAGALGLGIGFGLQNVISNFVSGLILVFERPILPGDTIEVNNLLGTVNKIGVRSSSISTFDGAEVVVPNNNLAANDLINWTLSNNIKRVEILIGTTYDSDPNQILEILRDCALSYEEAMKDPAPVALFSDFGDSSLNFKLRFWVHFEIGLQAKSDVSIAIYNKFKEHGIEIPFPQQDIYIKETPKKENND